MKNITVTIFVVLISIAFLKPNAFADKITELEKKVESLETSVGQLKAKSYEGLGTGVEVGGHFRMYMFDKSDGKRNGIKQHNNVSAGINSFYLSFKKELSDYLSMYVEPEISVSASATPSLGSDITRATSATTSTSFHRAYMLVSLPNDMVLKAGLISPLFSEEYGTEIWWHELNHQNKGLDMVETMSDQGLELYKNFDFEEWSLPLYLYLLNGKSLVDDNHSKIVLLHFAPELLQAKLRLLGSIGYGKWDTNDDYAQRRYALGFDWKYNALNIMSEYLYRSDDNVSLSGGNKEDGKRTGYYIRALYNITPKWKGLVKYSNVDLYKTGTTFMRTDNYEVLTVGINYLITETSTIISHVSFCDAERSDNSETLKNARTTIGWRTTF
ncbi:MAG: OprO/OprP family phosphate-selective porin [Candidatus Omnitrophica bacterium]|nr:OprO/OprP family phosphate-selective porin [Candidatus Omnitrophota bacterium]